MILQLHLPNTLKNYSIFEVGNNPFYFDDEKDKAAFKDYEEKAIKVLDEIKQTSNKKIFVSISGIMLEKIDFYQSPLKQRVKELIDINLIELVGETHHNSISYMFSINEFETQVKSHKKLLKSVFKVTPRVFKNTFLAFSESIAKSVRKLGFEYAVASHTEKGLMNVEGLKVLGVKESICKDALNFDVNESYDILSDFKAAKKIEYKPSTVELMENNLQRAAFNKLFSLEEKAKEKDMYLDVWRSLTSHDHFVKMSKASFEENHSPYEYFINFRNVLEDLSLRLN